MSKKNLWNKAVGGQRLDVASASDSKPYCSLHQFFLEHPIPSPNSDILEICSFYDSLHQINDAYLPEEQRKIRSNLLVSVGTYCGKIRQNMGARI